MECSHEVQVTELLDTGVRVHEKSALLCLYLPTLYWRFWSLTFLFINIKCMKLERQMELQVDATVFCGDFLWLKRGAVLSVLQRIISSSDFKVRCAALRHDLRLTFLYIEKTWIPMQWCWSNLRCRSYPIVFLIFWNRDGEVGGISSLSTWFGLLWIWCESIGLKNLYVFDFVKQIKWKLLLSL